MARTLADIDADLEANSEAIASGELIVQYQDKRVQYRTIEELRAARALLLEERAALAPTTYPSRIRRMTTRNGW